MKNSSKEGFEAPKNPLGITCVVDVRIQMSNGKMPSDNSLAARRPPFDSADGAE